MLNCNNLKALIFTLVITLHICSLFGVSQAQLQVGFYSQTCPAAESIVRDAVRQAVSSDPTNAAKLLRLIFHDCFVEGCDGSILLAIADNKGERDARGNLGLGGFDVVENAKAQLERVCPGVVSCADIVALAARDAVFLSRGPFYAVPTGRRDGRVSSVSQAANLPDVDDSIQILKSKFREKGLSDKDLVLLSGGGHTIGTTACFFMPKRLYNFTGNGDSDPAINPQLLPQLKAKCPFDGNPNSRLPLDLSSDLIFDDHILRNIKNGFAVLASDARLNDDKTTKQALDSYLNVSGSSSSKGTTRPSFKADFAAAMVKMGNIGVKTGSDGEIRRVCSSVN